MIIPSRRSEQTLPRALRSLEAAADGLDVETLVVEDAEGRGPSWARNRGLERATGEYVFFCDADDEVAPAFFRRPLETLADTGADLCFFTYAGGPRLESATTDGNAAVRETYLPAFFGYSNDDVRRWNRGGRLDALKQPGQVWRCACRRAFLEEHALRFDESMTYFEDAAFLSARVAFAKRAVSLPDELYVYHPAPTGNLATGWKGDRHWDYKFKALDFRKRLDARCGGALWRHCEASCALTALEFLKEHRADLPRYLADARVKAALRSFPRSPRHPLAAAAVTYLRWRTR